MHTLQGIDGYIVCYNGDFSGDVMIRSPKKGSHHEDGAEHWIPFHVLETVVAEKIRVELINSLEQADVDKLLYHNLDLRRD